MVQSGLIVLQSCLKEKVERLSVYIVRMEGKQMIKKILFIYQKSLLTSERLYFLNVSVLITINLLNSLFINLPLSQIL